MDLDGFVLRHDGAWRRLEHLARRGASSRGALSTAEVDELVALYQRTAAQLAYARHYYGDPGLTARLTVLVATANATIYGRGRRLPATTAVKEFLGRAFPAAVWDSRRFVALAAALLFVPALAVGAWLGTSDRALDVAVPTDEQEALLESEFEDYYSSSPAAEFSTAVLVNNIQVSFLAFALGVFLGIGTVMVLVYNGLNIGIAAGLFVHAGQADKFFGLVLPHGLLELTAIVIAGGAGLRLGWAVIDPGDRRRGAAVADEGRRAVVVVLGLMLCFVVAGVIEGFVTPSDLPTSVRVGIGIAVEVVFVLWVLACGRPATQAGEVRSEPAGGLGPEVDVADGTGELVGAGVDHRHAQPP